MAFGLGRSSGYRIGLLGRVKTYRGGLCRLRGMEITFLPHARERMDEYGISEEEVRSVVGQPEEEGTANLVVATRRRLSVTEGSE
jgi:hypothetical protein